MQIKSTNHFLKTINGREVNGIFAVHGNVDDGQDRSWPGSFAKTIQERNDRIRFLWQHDMSAPPIAKVVAIREVGRNELPDAVLVKAPEAMGGVEVTREYLDTPRGNEVLEGIKTGAITEMSYAYDAVKYDFEEDPNARSEWDRIRNLREVRLYEVSDVLWGMNPATQGSKSVLLPHLQWVIDFLSGLKSGKAGARHSNSDLEMINQIASNALALGATNIKLLDDAGTTDASNEDNGGKSREQQAEPDSLAIDFTLMRRQLMELDLATF